MALFPLFIDLHGKKCIVVGGGAVASRKIKTLLEFGADITVISPQFSPQILEWFSQGCIMTRKKEYSEGDISGAFLAVAAASEPEVNENVWKEALEGNIFINVADDPGKCTFTFPAVVKRDDLVIGITTSGGYPALTAKVREQIGEMFPQEYGELLKILGGIRRKAEAEIPSPQKRKEILLKLLDGALCWKREIRMDNLKDRLEAFFEELKNEANS